MKWEKVGRIFEATRLERWQLSHAAVPVAQHINQDIFRIYFSSRNAQNQSSTYFIDIDIKQPQEILNLSSEPVIAPGNLGTFDDSGAMLSWVTSHQDMNYLYYIGWNLGVTVPFRNSIGLVLNKKGTDNFEKYSEAPVLDRNAIDPQFVASSCVLIEQNIWRMWYLSCVKWLIINGVPQHWYHIRYAESKDGVHWSRDGQVCIDFKSSNEYAISRPCVLKENGVYRMWYSYRGDAYRIGYAESEDGLNWIRKDEIVGIDVSDSGWDSEMIEYPFVFNHKRQKYMFYNGNGYGKTGFGLAVLVN